MIRRVVTVVVTCDDCGRDTPLPASFTKKLAREHLRISGWSSNDKGDFCPECRMKRVRGE
jgi:hypothetical protein